MLGKGSAWSCDISPTLKHFVPETTQNIQDLTNFLSQFDLLNEGDRPYRSVQREVRAREQLALDLVLASNIYSSYPVASSKQVDENLESMAEALSLDNDAPPMQFGYLRPLKRDNGEEDKGSNGAVMGAHGVRMLLKEWQVGADPKAFVYPGSFHEDGSAPLVAKAEIAISSVIRPPTVAASSTPTLPKPGLVAGGSRFVAFSQDAGAVAETMADSQEVLASTQIVPGPYGGRSGLGKRKAGKKRLGGF
jgi:hypothetical protein